MHPRKSWNIDERRRRPHARTSQRTRAKIHNLKDIDPRGMLLSSSSAGPLALLLLLLLLLDVATSVPPPMNVRWRRHLEWYVGDLCYELPQCKTDWAGWFSEWHGHASAEQFADHAVSLGVDSMLIDALPSGAGRTTALAAGRAAGVPVFAGLEASGDDWFGQVTKALKARGLGVFAYINLVFNAAEVTQHPSHAWYHYNHSSSKPDGITATCLNAPQHLETYANLSQQLILHYGVDAVRYDGLMMPIDHHCGGCQQYYRKLYGEELPSAWAPAQWRRQLDFTRASYGRTVRHLRNAALAVKPDVLTWFNGFLFDPATVSPYGTPMQLTNSEDARASENMGFLEFGSAFMQAWTAGVVQPSAGVINGELFHEVKPGAAMDAALRATHSSVAQGGIAYQYLLFNKSTGLPDDCSSTDYPYYCYNRTTLKHVHGRIAAIQPFIDGTTPTAVAAIVYSEQTRYRYGSYDRSSYLAVLEGVFMAYSKRSVSILVLSSLDLTTPAALAGLELLVLPETSGLNTAQLAGLHSWVVSGGTVIVTGDALRFNETGFESEGGAFSADWLGVEFHGTTCWAAPHTWELSWHDSFVSRRQSNALCINRVQTRTGSDTEVTVSGTVLGVTPGGPFNVLTTRAVGKGRAAYLALKFDNGVGPGWPSVEGHADMTVPAIVDTMDMLLFEQPLRVLSPPGANASSAVVLTTRRGQWVLHFLTAELVEVELSAKHVNASAVVQTAPTDGWTVSTTVSDRGGLIVRVLSIDSTARDAFRLVVLKTDDSQNVPETVNLTVTRQHKSRTGRFGWRTTDELITREPSRTALIIIDMWEKYWCPSDVQSQIALASMINLTAHYARARGMMVIHAPSDCLAAYNNSPAREWVKMLPRAPTPTLENISFPPYPLYPCADYPNTCWPSCDSYWGDPSANPGQPLPWDPTRGHETAGENRGIDVLDEDAVVDTNSLEEFATIVAAKRLRTILYTGVATNMCVMDRAWGMHNALRLRLEPIILRELTETAYSPYDSPYVSKDESTRLMVGCES
jgi:nicotinamidase-related amidase